MYNFVAKEIDYANYFHTVSKLYLMFVFYLHLFLQLSNNIPVIYHTLLNIVSFFCLQLIETQAEYHRKSLEILHSVLPQIKAQQGESHTQ